MWYVNDLECQNAEWFGATAAPHNPDNYIVAAGWSIDDGEVQHKYFNSKEEADSSDWLAKSLQGQKMYVAHNLTFELQWLLSRHKDVILDWIKQGGRFFDSQYAEFLLSNQTHQYPALEDLSVKYRDAGMSEYDVRKLDEVKILWESGVLTADIDKELLLSYLCDPVHGDIANTRRVCFKQYAELKRRGMWKMFQVRMDSLLFNAIATFNGLYVNQPIAQKNLEEQLAAIEELQANITRQLPEDLPPELEFSFTSGYHLSALLFGGEIKYRKQVSYSPKKYKQVDAYQLDGGIDDGDFIATTDLPDYPVGQLEGYVGTPFVKYKSGKRKGKLSCLRLTLLRNRLSGVSVLTALKDSLISSVYLSTYQNST